MKLKSNIIDPYVGQEAEGKKIKFASVDKIEVEELKVFLFDNKKISIKKLTFFDYKRFKNSIKNYGIFLFAD